MTDTDVWFKFKKMFSKNQLACTRCVDCWTFEEHLEKEQKTDALAAAAPEEAAVPLPLCGPLGEGIHLGFGALGYAFCSPIMFDILV